MLPPIEAILGVELIRDGGSLAATFLGNNGAEYSLWFGLIQEHEASGKIVRLGYKKPVVFERFNFHELRDEREISGWCAINETVVSWNHALVLLHQIRRYTKEERDHKWLDAMEEVAISEGTLCLALQDA